MNSKQISSCDYFAGGVTPGLLFNISLNNLNEILRSDNAHPRTVVEICLIGLVAYFEAFCKGEFASLINICPPLLKNFCEKRTDVTVDVKDLVTFEIETHNQLGFLIAEKYDFGSAKKINSLYKDLLNITPFSKTEARRYDRLLQDRNLLVHDAGIYTIGYAKSRIQRQNSNTRIFLDSLIITYDDFYAWSRFLDSMANKIVDTCYEKLTKYVENNNIKLSDEGRSALGIFHAYNT